MPALLGGEDVIAGLALTRDELRRLFGFPDAEDPAWVDDTADGLGLLEDMLGERPVEFWEAEYAAGRVRSFAVEQRLGDPRPSVSWAMTDRPARVGVPRRVTVSGYVTRADLDEIAAREGLGYTLRPSTTDPHDWVATWTNGAETAVIVG